MAAGADRSVVSGLWSVVRDRKKTAAGRNLKATINRKRQPTFCCRIPRDEVIRGLPSASNAPLFLDL
jgi:hypothetical protein